MAEHPLTKYLKEARRNGLSSDRIVGELTSAGWRIHDILDVVLEHLPVESPPRSENIISISVRELQKSFGKMKALDGISLDVKAGTVTALLGPNGAGKTTLIRILTTLLGPDHGQAMVAGYDVVRDAAALRFVIGLAGQYAAVDEILSGRENLEMVGRLYHMSLADARSRSTDLLKQFELDDAADRPVKTYSGGMRRRLDLAASLVINPKILFLDEPTTGLDPHGRFTLWQIIRDLVAGGTTVLLTTQYLEEADQLANQVFVIDHGHIIAAGTPDELKSRVGGDVLEVRLDDHGKTSAAAEAIGKFGDEPPHLDESLGKVTMPVSSGSPILVDVIRELERVGIKISDIILRRPSLDDVFIKLTGHGAESS